MTLTQKLRARLAFDEDVPRQESYRLDEAKAQAFIEEYFDNYSYIEGARFENARLKPVFEKLIKCVEALERQQYPHIEQCCKRRAQETLAALEKCLEEK